ncbi:hypothetical protein AB0C41_18975 [Micromonospora taraxaci]|uniref:hypothetical protein n=1 Tax=Micromonospora taraxaci TaxID=1316803 RepID=UPI0033D1B3E4
MSGVSDKRQGDDEKAEQCDDGIGRREEHCLAEAGVAEVGQVEEEVRDGEGGECRRCGDGECGSWCDERYAEDDGQAEGQPLLGLEIPRADGWSPAEPASAQRLDLAVAQGGGESHRDHRLLGDCRAFPAGRLR